MAAEPLNMPFNQGTPGIPRFAGLIHVVRACAANAEKAMLTGKISFRSLH